MLFTFYVFTKRVKDSTTEEDAFIWEVGESQSLEDSTKDLDEKVHSQF